MWGEATHHVIWLMNRTQTTAVVGMTPYKATFGKKPDLSNVEYFTLPHAFQVDLSGFRAESEQNGRNGWNLVGMKC